MARLAGSSFAAAMARSIAKAFEGHQMYELEVDRLRRKVEASLQLAYAKGFTHGALSAMSDDKVERLRKIAPEIDDV